MFGDIRGMRTLFHFQITKKEMATVFKEVCRPFTTLGSFNMRKPISHQKSNQH